MCLDCHDHAVSVMPVTLGNLTVAIGGSDITTSLRASHSRFEFELIKESSSTLGSGED